MQSASNEAAAVVAAAIQAGQLSVDEDGLQELLEVFAGIRDFAFEKLEEKAVQDDESFEATTKDSLKRLPKGSSIGGGRKSSKPKVKRGGGKATLEDALAMELNFGAFEGETLEKVLSLDAKTCDEDYGYGDGERDGTDYLKWLASDRNNNEFVKRRAVLVIEDAGIELDE